MTKGTHFGMHQNPNFRSLRPHDQKEDVRRRCGVRLRVHPRPLLQDNYSAKKYAEIYLDQIICLHGVPKTITSDRGAQIIARFWEQLQAFIGTKLIRSSAYHPQTDGQTKMVNQILEYMLRACIIQYDKN